MACAHSRWRHRHKADTRQAQSQRWRRSQSATNATQGAANSTHIALETWSTTAAAGCQTHKARSAFPPSGQLASHPAGQHQSTKTWHTRKNDVVLPPPTHTTHITYNTRHRATYHDKQPSRRTVTRSCTTQVTKLCTPSSHEPLRTTGASAARHDVAFAYSGTGSTPPPRLRHVLRDGRMSRPSTSSLMNAAQCRKEDVLGKMTLAPSERI